MKTSLKIIYAKTLFDMAEGMREQNKFPDVLGQVGVIQWW